MSATTAAAASPPAAHAHRWAGPYGPLRPGRLLAELGVLVVAEALLLRVYGSYDSSFHWAAHFLVGLIAAVGWLAAVLLITARPARGQILMVLPFHLYAMFPDLVYRRGVPHGHWSDAFLAHIRVHYIPGGDRTWVALAAATVLAYALLLSRWVAARTIEADHGMAPGIGIGGSRRLDASARPRGHPLAHAHHGPRPDRPRARTVVLLHGLGGTGSTWARVVDALRRTAPRPARPRPGPARPRRQPRHRHDVRSRGPGRRRQPAARPPRPRRRRARRPLLRHRRRRRHSGTRQPGHRARPGRARPRSPTPPAPPSGCPAGRGSPAGPSRAHPPRASSAARCACSGPLLAGSRRGPRTTCPPTSPAAACSTPTRPTAPGCGPCWTTTRCPTRCGTPACRPWSCSATGTRPCPPTTSCGSRPPPPSTVRVLDATHQLPLDQPDALAALVVGAAAAP